MSISRVDHLVYATPDLERTVAELEGAWGVRATQGGSHPGRGTRNALIGLGPRQYLEIIAPDPAQDVPANPRWFGMDGISMPRLAGWAVACADLAATRARAVTAGATLGEIAEGSRTTPAGATLRWSFTDPRVTSFHGLMPFLIDWGSGPHPSDGLPAGLRLSGLELHHPDPEALGAALESAGITWPGLFPGAPRMHALLQSLREPATTFELE